MQNKGAIRLFAILLAVVSLYQLLFTFATKRVEKKAAEYALSVSKGDLDLAQLKEAAYLDSMNSQTALNLLVTKFTYKECKEKEINLGLDLKGGMNLTLEVKVGDILKALSNYNTDPSFLQALKQAEVREKKSTSDFITLFGEEFAKIDPNGQLAAIFSTPELKDKVDYKMTNDQVLKVIRVESANGIDNAFNIIRTRIDRFGVTQPNIQKLEQAGRVLVELPGIKEPQRVRKLLQGTASLEFWETYDNQEVYQYIAQADALIRQTGLATSAVDTTVTPTSAKTAADDDDLLSVLDKGTSTTADSAGTTNVESLFSYLMPSQFPNGPVVGAAHARDTAKVNHFLNLDQVKNILPANLRLLWAVKSHDADNVKESEAAFQLYAIKVTTHDGRAPLEGDVITRATADASHTGGGFEVGMSMNSEGAKAWARLTRANIGKSIAIVLDGYVYSYPVVRDEISGGRSSISGDFTVEEAQDLANILKSGKLPAPARIVEDTVVGPSLGKEAISSGLVSFVAAFILVLAYMVFYYNRAGWIANAALLVNVFFLFGVMASFGAVLTLPGLAGITLSIGMAIDANVIIYERIREELKAGKGIRLAVADGFKHAYSAILDGNITTLLVAIILYVFGTGPIQGFATTLIIGLLTSMFCGIFITRLILERLLDKNKPISFSTKMSENILRDPKIDFIGMRKKLYVLSGTVILIGLVSSFVYGFNYGIDFEGGRAFVIRYDGPVNTVELQERFVKEFDGTNTEVKVFGGANQIKATTKYLIDADETNSHADSLIVKKLYHASQGIIPADVTPEKFSTSYIMSSQKVGPSISDDIKMKAISAILFSLLVTFLYIFVRFRDWRFGLGAVISLAHDSLIVIGMFSLLKDVMPFSMEIDSSFIAAILTVIGYSLNDTIIIYDRIREYRREHVKWDAGHMFNGAMNSTLRRTMNTSLSTLFVLLVIFLFGGEVLRGFVFALLVGIGVGTYSSIFNAAPIVYDLLKIKKKK
ncbi:MAG: protein translocase subunit SecDF [Breznakibacter sp.]